jgi:hypothetical protein
MTPEPTDPTAGRRARDAYRNPGAPQPISDPTDPRYGQTQPGLHEVVVDPTDPRQPSRQFGRPGHVYPRA